MSLLEIDEKEFKEEVDIYFESIIEGFDKYKNLLLLPKETNDSSLVEENYIGFVRDLYNLNDKKLVIDFYISNLDNIEYKCLYDSLDINDKEILKIIKNKNYTSKYFKVIEENIIDFLVKLCTREKFFVTFYFTKKPLTIWGNYNYKFPIFYKEEENVEYLNKILNAHNIIINT